MDDQELRDKLASEARPLGKLLSPYEQDLWSAGWDAARANQVDGWLAQNMELHVANIDNLIKERDHFKAAAEKLAEALERIAMPVAEENPTLATLLKTIANDIETAEQALAKYRKLDLFKQGDNE